MDMDSHLDIDSRMDISQYICPPLSYKIKDTVDHYYSLYNSP